MKRRVKRQTFLLRLRPEPGVNGVRALRSALKGILRRFGLKALDVREETPDREVRR